MLFSVVLILVGVLYMVKPDLYNKKAFRKESAVGQNVFSEKGYNTMMRILGAIIFIIGIASLLKHRQ